MISSASDSHGRVVINRALDPAELTISVQAEVLRGLAQCEAVQLAAASRVFTAFGRSGGAAADGAATPRSWLRWQCRVTSAAAGLAAAWARRLAAHPRIADALARAEVSVSWAKALCEWTDELPEAHRDAADGVLLDAAGARAGPG